MIIRAATTHDAAQICAFWNPLIKDTAITFTTVLKTTQDIKNMIQSKADGGHGYFVACEDDTVLGFGTYGQFRSGPGYAHCLEHSIILAPQARGRGIGTALMHHVLDHASRAGGHSMLAGISSENPDVVAFHESLGFEYVATLPQVGRKFGRWMDLVLMQKFL